MARTRLAIICQRCGRSVLRRRDKSYRQKFCSRFCAGRQRQSQALSIFVAPTRENIAWAAGIFEGEGSFAHSGLRRIRATVSQKDEWILLRLQQFFGGAIALVHRNDGKPNYFTWTVTGSSARWFIASIESWLSPRRRAQLEKHTGVPPVSDSRATQVVVTTSGSVPR